MGAAAGAPAPALALAAAAAPAAGGTKKKEEGGQWRDCQLYNTRLDAMLRVEKAEQSRI